MSQQELLARVVHALDSMGVPYMVTGSIAAGFLGHPRMSHDVDLVVDLAYKHVDALVAAFLGPRYYLDPGSVRRAIAQGQHVNLLDNDTGDKVDFWMLGDAPFDAERMARRRRIPYVDAYLYVTTAEDLILKKLEFAKEIGGSAKQTADAVAIARYNRSRLDVGHLNRWAATLGIREEWDRVRRDAGIE